MDDIHNWWSRGGGGCCRLSYKGSSEETGYSDIELVRTLGGPTEAFFHAAHKGVNRQTQSQIILFNLKSNKRIKVADDEKARHEAVWLKEEEVL